MSWYDFDGPCPTCGVNVDPDVHDCPVYGGVEEVEDDGTATA